MNEQVKTNQIDLVELLIKCKDWFSYLLKHWKLIIFVGLAGGIIGLTVSYFSKPTYTAVMTFALEDGGDGGSMSGALGLASQLGFDLGVQGGGAFAGSNLIELFKSRKMVEKTLLSPVKLNNETISLAEMYVRDLGWRSDWAKKPNLKDIQYLPYADRTTFTREQDSILGRICMNLQAGNLNVTQKDKEVAIITIEVKSGNEYFAKYFTEALAKEVSDFYVLTKNNKARMNLEILEKQTDSVRAELNNSILGVAVSNDNTFGLNPAMNVRRVPSSRKEVDVQANGTMLVELVKQTELAKVTLRRETPLIQIIDVPILPLKKEKLGKLKGIVLFGSAATLFTILILLTRRSIKRFSKEQQAAEQATP